MPVRFVAIINPDNSLCYFRAAEGTSEDLATNYKFLAEMSLDFIDEFAHKAVETNYIKQLFTHDGLTVFGLANNTKVKTIMAVSDILPSERITDMLTLVSNNYVNQQMNPFGNSQEIKSTQFDSKIDAIIKL